MSLAPPNPPRGGFVFALPPSLDLNGGDAELARKLTDVLGKPVRVQTAGNYDALAKDLLAERVDAAWAPPFVCARVEAMGARVLVRGVRRGTSSYRAALMCRAEAKLTADQLEGLTAVWIDRDSVSGYLLPMAFLRARGIEPKTAFPVQSFTGSYRASLDKVANGDADVTAIFAPAGTGDATGLEQIAPELTGKLVPFAFTDESPNDAVAVARNVPQEDLARLEQALTSLHETPDGKRLLDEVFKAERFERAPRLGYRALYRVAIAGL